MWAAALRWSMSERAWCGFFRSLQDGRILCRYELTWVGKSPELAATNLKAFCSDRRIFPGYYVAQAAIFPKEREVGETVSETLSRAGLPMREGSKDRLACWARVRSWLEPRVWPDGKTSPALIVHEDCKFLIETLPTLVKSETEPDDVAEVPDEYPAMGLALYAMSRPSPWFPWRAQ